MSFEMLAFDGLRKPAKGSRRVCGCHVEQTTRRGAPIHSPFAPTGPWTARAERPGAPMVVCPGYRRFASRAEAMALFRREQAQGEFCVYVKPGKRCKTGYRRKSGRCAKV